MRHTQTIYDASQRRACVILDVTCNTARRPLSPDRDTDLRRRLWELAEERRCFGERLYILQKTLPL